MTMMISAVRTPSGVVLSRQSFLIDHQGGTLGRGKNNDWILPDPERIISARHCTINFDGGRYYLTDLSTNGTYINDALRPLGKGETVPLRDGDCINMGGYEFQVALGKQLSVGSVRTAAYVHEPYDETDSAQWSCESKLPTMKARAMSLDQDVREHSSAGRLRRKIVRDMGIEEKHLSQQALSRVIDDYGSQAPLIVDGLMRLLRARAGIKNGLRLEVTTIDENQNNPLKFSADANEAIEKLFVNKKPGDMPSTASLVEAFDNISDHQVALMAAVKSAFRQAMELLDPEKFEQDLLPKGKGSMLQSRNKAKMWEAYREKFHALLDDREGAFQALFGESFIRTYESQVTRLEAERIRRNENLPDKRK